jgi:hypothetical protein
VALDTDVDPETVVATAAGTPPRFVAEISKNKGAAATVV